MIVQVSVKIAPGSLVDLFQGTDTEYKCNDQGLSPEIGMALIEPVSVDIVGYHLTCMQGADHASQFFKFIFWEHTILFLQEILFTRIQLPPGFQMVSAKDLIIEY